jgi:hypothetical protein
MLATAGGYQPGARGSAGRVRALARTGPADRGPAESSPAESGPADGGGD